MNVPLPSYVTSCIERLRLAGYEAYAVGGCVRDALLGKEAKDYDVTTSATPERVTALFSKCVPTGVAFGTVTVVDGKGIIEVTTFRQDGRYTEHRRPDWVRFTSSVEEDLARRDFTVNAMAYAPDVGLIDLFGGVDDLHNRIIRTVGDPYKRFGEDALRILRAFRFASQLDFTIEEKTRAAALDEASMLGEVSAERVQGELLRGLTGISPSRMQPLLKSAALEPWGIGKAETLLLLDAVVNEPAARLAALCWLTEADGEQVCRRLNCSSALRQAVCGLLKGLEGPLPQTPEEVRQRLFESGPIRLQTVLGLRRVLQSEDTEQAQGMLCDVLQKGEAYSLPMLAVSGKDLLRMGIPAGEPIGKLLHMLLQAVLENPQDNTRERLLSLARKHLPSSGFDGDTR